MKNLSHYSCLVVFLICAFNVAGQGAQQNKVQCDAYFKKIYESSLLQPAPKNGQAYRMKSRYIVRTPQEQEPDTDVVEMISDGRKHYFRSGTTEMYGNEKVAVYVNRDHKQIMITTGLPPEIMQKKLNFSEASGDSLFKYSRLETCRNVTLQDGKQYLQITYNVLPYFRQRFGLRKMEYYIDESTDSFKQIQLIYHNRPDVSRMLVIFDEKGYEQQDILPEDPLSQIYERKELKTAYAGYTVKDQRKKHR